MFHSAAQEILDAFREVPKQHRLELLLEYSKELPDLPERYANHPELLERVEECQSPVFLFTELHSNKVSVFLTAPLEAPTTRGFASILQHSLDEQSPDTILQFDEDFISQLGLTELVSPLRINGMHGMLARIKRQVKEKSAAN